MNFSLIDSEELSFSKKDILESTLTNSLYIPDHLDALCQIFKSSVLMLSPVVPVKYHRKLRKFYFFWSFKKTLISLKSMITILSFAKKYLLLIDQFQT